MILEIDGLDIVPYIAYGGFKWGRNDVDGDGAGRSLDDAILHRDRLAIKMRLDITLIPLQTAQLRQILQAIKPEFVTVRYEDPQDGLVQRTMYSNNFPAQYLMKKDGKEYWGGVTFPLIER